MPKSKRLRYDPYNDLYVVLGIASSATATELQSAFRQRAKEVHPDLNPTRLDWAHDQFRRLNEAYDVLSSPALRDEYDRLRSPYQAGGSTYSAQPRSSEGQSNSVPFGTARGARTSSRPSSRPTAASRAAWARHGYIRPSNRYSLAYVGWVLRRRLGGPYRGLLALLVILLTVNILFIVMFAPFFSAATQRSLQTMYFAPLPAGTNQIDPHSVCDATAGVNVLQPANDATLNDHAFSIIASVPAGIIRKSEIELLTASTQSDGIPSRWNLVSAVGQPMLAEHGQLQTLASLSNIPEGTYSLSVAITRDDGTVLGPCALTIHHQR